MHKQKYLTKITCVIICLALLTGCASLPDFSDISLDTLQTTAEDDGITSLGLTPEFTYDVPVSLPNILTDQVGYAENSNKVAVIQGEVPPDTFSIIDADSGEMVYTGTIEQKGYDEESGTYISYGDFTDFKTPGRYYIQAAMIGQSYPFEIAENIYDDLFRITFKQYYYNRCGLTLSSELAGDAAHNACHAREAQMKDEATVKLDVTGGWHMDDMGSRDVVTGCQTVNSLLLAYELSPEMFDDDMGIPESGNDVPDILDEVKYEIDWLLKMQDTKSGAVYASVSSVDNKAAGYILYIDGVTMEATIQFAATLAKFSYLYQTIDRDFATQCLKASDRAYRYAQKYLTDISQEEYFYAATELYRATGASSYHTVIKNYLAQNEVTDMENDFVFWGCVTYLSTKQKVDVNLCSEVISVLMQEAEQISYASKNSKLLINADVEQGNSADMLQSLSRLAVVDHIITNHEYATVLENHLHYLLGRNLESVTYLNDVGARNYKDIDPAAGIMNRIDQNAELMLAMSAILSEEESSGTG
jgi:endoglucanase